MATYPNLLTAWAVFAAVLVTASDRHQAQANMRIYTCAHFDAGSAELPPGCLERLSEFAALWRRVRDGRDYNSSLPRSDPNASVPLPPRLARVAVEGHSLDERDSINLAFLRAARIARELERLGVSPDIIRLSGHTNFPDDRNDRRSGFNRRVVFILW